MSAKKPPGSERQTIFIHCLVVPLRVPSNGRSVFNAGVAQMALTSEANVFKGTTLFITALKGALGACRRA
ncbi:hypothetical protein [Candidatus Sororendozoicomonas aggregata]|uniref:hypothetical protein n=1 Tax=Candidatus Sororendozoicomonas aggregata TaxID=3073239 RepID=UPI002ED1A3FE